MSPEQLVRSSPVAGDAAGQACDGAAAGGRAFSPTVEGIARVVRIENGRAWFEPEQTTSCGHCASASACGAGSAAFGGGNGIGSIARRIELRRFPLDAADGLRAGDRVVVGVDARALLKASATAYAIPLLAAIIFGVAAQGFFGDDLITMVTMFAGLAAGMLLARRVARRLAVRGELSPRLLRRTTHREALQ